MQTTVQLYTETPESKAKWEAYRVAKQAEYRAAGLIVDRPEPTRNERYTELLMQGPAGDDHRTYTREEVEAYERTIEVQLEAEGYGPPVAPEIANGERFEGKAPVLADEPGERIDIVVIEASKADRLAHAVDVARRRGMTVRRCPRTGAYLVEASTRRDVTFVVTEGCCSCSGFAHKGCCTHVGAVVAHLADHEHQPPPAAPSRRSVTRIPVTEGEAVSHAA